LGTKSTDVVFFFAAIQVPPSFPLFIDVSLIVVLYVEDRSLSRRVIVIGGA
jgi:hypothetical protein